MPVELKVAGSNPGVVHFFSPSLFFFSFPFFPFPFFSPLVSFFSSPFHYPLQARSATSMLKHFSSYMFDINGWYTYMLEWRFTIKYDVSIIVCTHASILLKSKDTYRSRATPYFTGV